MKPTLYELSREGLEMSAILEEMDGELTPQMEAALDELMAAGQDRVEAAAMIVKRLEAEANAVRSTALSITAEAQRLEARAFTIEASAERLKSRMAAVLDAVFGGKVKTPLFTVYVQQSPVSIHFEAEEQMLPLLPQNLVVHSYKLNKLALRELHRCGSELPCQIAISETPGKRSCRIR